MLIGLEKNSSSKRLTQMGTWTQTGYGKLKKTKMKQKLISIIIPVFQNQGSLIPTYQRAVKTVLTYKNACSYEIIFINDGSTDGSTDELISIAEQDPRVKLVNFSRNFGQVSAIIAGMKVAEGDLLINISADLQDPPELIAEMLDHYFSGSPLVICSRQSREDSIISGLTSKVFYKIIQHSIPEMPSSGFDYFLLDKSVYKSIAETSEKNNFLQGDILWFGYKPVVIPYKRIKRKIGKSQWSFFKKLKYFYDGLISVSNFPIRAMTFTGGIFALSSIIFSFVVVIGRLTNKSPFPGYAPLIIVLLLSTGSLMIMMGVIGEYIWRIYDETKKKPRYIIKDIINRNDETK